MFARVRQSGSAAGGAGLDRRGVESEQERRTDSYCLKELELERVSAAKIEGEQHRRAFRVRRRLVELERLRELVDARDGWLRAIPDGRPRKTRRRLERWALEPLEGLESGLEFA
jgi:hypothetical protein